jgi:hypothetical protein
MSRATVGFLIDCLLTNANLRLQFAQHPLETLVELSLRAGIELTPDEIDAFVRTDPETWFANDRIVPGPVH